MDQTLDFKSIALYYVKKAQMTITSSSQGLASHGEHILLTCLSRTRIGIVKTSSLAGIGMATLLGYMLGALHRLTLAGQVFIDQVFNISMEYCNCKWLILLNDLKSMVETSLSNIVSNFQSMSIAK